MNRQFYFWLGLLIFLLLVIMGITAAVLLIEYQDVVFNSSSLDENIMKQSYLQNSLEMNTSNKTINQNLSEIPIYIINLERSKDRRQYMEEQISKYQIDNVKFVNAIDGKLFDETNTYKLKDGTVISFKHDGNASNYEIACTLSHLYAMKEFLKSDKDVGLILEDDVTFIQVPHWEKSLNHLLKDAPTDWEILSLYNSAPKQYPDGKFIPFNLNRHAGMQSYLINRSAAQKILEKVHHHHYFELRSTLIHARPVADRILYLLLKSYVYTKSLFTTLNNNIQMSSMIHDDHTNSHILTAIRNLKDYYNRLLNSPYQIPKILHLIWIGPKRRPKMETWIKDFASAHPDWTIKIWNDQMIDQLNLINRKEYDKMKEWCGKADIARYEILYREGGMYIDADTQWLHHDISPILSEGQFNITRENPTSLANTWMYSVPQHPFLKLIIDNIPDSMALNPDSKAWIVTGPYLLHHLYEKIKKLVPSKDINIIPIEKVICPTKWHGLTASNYERTLDYCQKETDALLFHWGYSTNQQHIFKD